MSREIAESKEEPNVSEAIKISKAESVPLAEEEISYSLKKKKDRKFKVAAKRAIYCGGTIPPLYRSPHWEGLALSLKKASLLT